jgi:hypothetical protein
LRAENAVTTISPTTYVRKYLNAKSAVKWWIKEEEARPHLHTFAARNIARCVRCLCWPRVINVTWSPCRLLGKRRRKRRNQRMKKKAVHF